MVEYEANLNQTFAALSDPTRRAILARLQRGPTTVGELARPFDMTLNAVSKHVRTLERAGLVLREIQGREHHLALCASPLQQANEFTDRYRAFWEGRLDALVAHVEERFADAETEGESSEIEPAPRPSPRKNS